MSFCYFPDALKKKMDDAYFLFKDLFPSKNIDTLTNMIFERHPIHIIITRNKVIAQKIKKQILTSF